MAEGLVVDESSVYWIAAGQLLRVAQSGGRTEVLAPFGSGARSDLAGDDVAIYFSTGTQLVRVPKSGGPPAPLRSAKTQAFEVFGDYLYWISNLGAAPASVMATPLREPGPDVVIATSAEPVNALAVSDAGVFWSSCAEEEPGTQSVGVLLGEGALHASYWVD